MENNNTCTPRIESPMEKVHWMIHEISYQLSIGNIKEAKKILVEADKFTHEHCQNK